MIISSEKFTRQKYKFIRTISVSLLLFTIFSCDKAMVCGELKVVRTIDDQCVVSNSGDTAVAFGLFITNTGQYTCTKISCSVEIFEKNKISELGLFDFSNLEPGDTAYSQVISAKYSSHRQYQKYLITMDWQSQCVCNP